MSNAANESFLIEVDLTTTVRETFHPDRVRVGEIIREWSELAGARYITVRRAGRVLMRAVNGRAALGWYTVKGAVEGWPSYA